MNHIEHLMNDENIMNQIRDFAHHYELPVDYIFEEFCIDGVFETEGFEMKQDKLS